MINFVYIIYIHSYNNTVTSTLDHQGRNGNRQLIHLANYFNYLKKKKPVPFVLWKIIMKELNLNSMKKKLNGIIN